MRDARRAHLPAGLQRARERFDQWRRNRTRRTISAELWSSAVELAGEFGVWPTAQALGLNGRTLRERLESSATIEGQSSERKMTFVEVMPPPRPSTAAECRIELEDGRGLKLRLDVKGGDMSQLAELAWRLWRDER